MTPASASPSTPSSGGAVQSTIFVDTDVLIYVRDATDSHRQARADQWVTHLWRSRTGRTSYQVLAEYYFAVTERLDPGLEAEVAREDVRDLLAWRPLEADETVLEGAWGLHADRQLAWWDALVVASAQSAGCQYLLTAALPHGREFEGLEVINPFEDPPPAYLVHDVAHHGP